MKVQFIIVGWHYHQTEFYEGLKELNDNNENINVFWSCHKEPTKFIKNNFEYKLFPNVGEEFIAYQQAVEYLNLEDDTVCFFIHDDVIIKKFFSNFKISLIRNASHWLHVENPKDFFKEIIDWI